MTSPHFWRECFPVLLRISEDETAIPEPPSEAVAMAWSLVPDDDRLMFHEYCCLGIKDETHLEATERIIDVLTGAGIGITPET